MKLFDTGRADVDGGIRKEMMGGGKNCSKRNGSLKFHLISSVFRYILRQLQEPHTPAQMISPIAYPFSGGVTSPHSAKLDTDADTWAVAPPIVTPSLASMAPVFRQHLRDLSLTEGTDVVLQCSVVGVPKPRVCLLLLLLLFMFTSDRLDLRYCVGEDFYNVKITGIIISVQIRFRGYHF